MWCNLLNQSVTEVHRLTNFNRGYCRNKTLNINMCHFNVTAQGIEIWDSKLI